jgi:hypothetical protein
MKNVQKPLNRDDLTRRELVVLYKLSG